VSGWGEWGFAARQYRIYDQLVASHIANCSPNLAIAISMSSLPLDLLPPELAARTQSRAFLFRLLATAAESSNNISYDRDLTSQAQTQGPTLGSKDSLVWGALARAGVQGLDLDLDLDLDLNDEDDEDEEDLEACSLLLQADLVTLMPPLSPNQDPDPGLDFYSLDPFEVAAVSPFLRANLRPVSASVPSTNYVTDTDSNKDTGTDTDIDATPWPGSTAEAAMRRCLFGCSGLRSGLDKALNLEVGQVEDQVNRQGCSLGLRSLRLGLAFLELQARATATAAASASAAAAEAQTTATVNDTAAAQLPVQALSWARTEGHRRLSMSATSLLACDLNQAGTGAEGSHRPLSHAQQTSLVLILLATSYYSHGQSFSLCKSPSPSILLLAHALHAWRRLPLLRTLGLLLRASADALSGASEWEWALRIQTRDQALSSALPLALPHTTPQALFGGYKDPRNFRAPPPPIRQPRVLGCVLGGTSGAGGAVSGGAGTGDANGHGQYPKQESELELEQGQGQERGWLKALALQRKAEAEAVERLVARLDAPQEEGVFS